MVKVYGAAGRSCRGGRSEAHLQALTPAPAVSYTDDDGRCLPARRLTRYLSREGWNMSGKLDELEARLSDLRDSL